MLDAERARELRIPVSFGHIAAQEWGPPNGKPVLALHGWLDNSNSFVPLIQHLSSNLHIVAIDFPGHGFSSHLGPGAVYQMFHHVVAITNVVNYLKWDTFSILGHSMGAVIAIIFASTFPSRVENLIAVDVIRPRDFKTKSLPELMIRYMDLEMREFTEQKEMTWDEIITQLKGIRPIGNENTTLLLKRSVKPGSREGSYVFLRDHRLKLMLQLPLVQLSPENVMGSFKEFSGNWLVFLQERRRTIEAPIIEEVREMYAKNCKLFKVVHVNGRHFMHMENPELIAPYINEMFDLLPKY